MKLNVSINKQSLRRELARIEKAIRDGTEDGVENLLPQAEEAARSKLEQNRQPFNSPHLRDSFDTRHFWRGDTLTGLVTNSRTYAAYVDQGVSGTEVNRDTPFSYDSTKPPIDPLIEWVEENINDWEPSDRDGLPFETTDESRLNDEDEPRGDPERYREQLGDENLNVLDDGADYTDGIDDNESPHLYDEIDPDSASEFSVGEKVIFETKRSATARLITDVNEEDNYIELTNKVKVFDGGSYDGDETEMDRKILARKDITPPQQLSEGDEILIDPDRIPSPPSSYEDANFVYAKVRKVSAGGRITWSDVSGINKETSSPKFFKEYYASRSDWEVPWEIRDRSRNDTLEDLDGKEVISDEDRGFVEIKDYYDPGLDKQYKLNSLDDTFGGIFQTKSVPGNTVLIDGVSDIISFGTNDKYLKFYEQNKDPASVANVTPVESFDIENTEDGERYYVFEWESGEYKIGEVDESGVTGHTLDPKDSIGTYSIYQDYPNSDDKDLNAVQVLGKVPENATASENTAFDPDGNVELWYGQELTYRHNGETYTHRVAGWDNDYVQLESDAPVDEVPMYPQPGETDEIVDKQDWSELTTQEQKAQIESEFDYRILKSVSDLDAVDSAKEQMLNNYEKMRTDETFRSVLSNFERITDQTKGGVAGSVKANGVGEKLPQYRLSISRTTGTSFITTFRHEFHHAVQRSGPTETDRGFHKFYSGLSIDFDQEYPIPTFNDDGSLDQELFDDLVDDDRHEVDGIAEYPNALSNTLMKDLEENVIGPSTLPDPVDASQIDEENVEQIDVDGDELFDPEPANIQTGDTISVIDSGGDSKELTFTGNAKKDKDDKTLWKFFDDDEDIAYFEVDSETGDKTDYNKLDVQWKAETGVSSHRLDTGEKFTPSQEDDMLALAEGINYALRKQYATFKADYEENGELTSRSFALTTRRGYTSSRAVELGAGFTEVIRAETRGAALQLPQLYSAFPGVVETFLKMYDPSEQAERVIKEQIPELQEYL